MAGLGRKIYYYLANRCAWIDKRPVFILGNQKTGSTAIASLLGKATGHKTSQDFLYTFKPPGQDLLLKEKIPLNEIVSHNKTYFSKKIIKELDLIFCMDQVVSCFPEGKFVCIIRDPRDNIRSILNRLKIPGNLDRVPDEHWKTLPNSIWHDMLKGTIYGTQGGCYINTLAKRWCFIIEQYETYKSKMHLLRYEDFIRDKVLCISHLAKQLDLEVLNDIQDSVDIQFQPRGNSDISWEEFFGEKNLNKIEKICADKMTVYGYKSVVSNSRG